MFVIFNVLLTALYSLWNEKLLTTDCIQNLSLFSSGVNLDYRYHLKNYLEV